MRFLPAVVLLTICTGCGHPWFKSGSKAPADQQPVLVAPISAPTTKSVDGYMPGTASWVPLIDECMREGRSRGDCIAALPADELASLEAWEQANGEWRRERMLRYRQRVPKLGVEDEHAPVAIP